MSLKDYGRAWADFAAAARLNPLDAEAHTGLGYVRARMNSQAEAQQCAAQALRREASDYLVLHNVACLPLRDVDHKLRPLCAHVVIEATPCAGEPLPPCSKNCSTALCIMP